MKTSILVCFGAAMLFACSDDNNGSADGPVAADAPSGGGADAPKADAGAAVVLHATLAQANEVGNGEPCAAAGAGATATITVTVNPDNSIAVTNFTYSNLSGPPQMAHIHFGATGVAGPVVVAFTGLPGTASGTIPNKTFTMADYPGTNPTGLTGYADFIAKLKAGMAYANIHTGACGSGEVRGQLVAQ